MAEETIIIDIEVSNEQATKAIQSATVELNRLRAEQLELTKAYNSGEKTRKEYTDGLKSIKKQMSDNNAIIKANEKVLQDNEKQMLKNGNSLKAMQSQLKEMIKEYSNLSKAERDGAKGTELLKKIDTQRQEVEKLEHALGDYRRQVGNYKIAVENLQGPIGAVARLFSKFSNGTFNITTALKNAGIAAAGFGKQLLKLLANPFVAMFAAIAAAVMKLVDAFKQNDTAMTNLQSLMASFKPILDVINGVFTSLASAIGNVVGKVSEVVQSITNAIPALRAFAKEEENIIRQRDALEERQRQNQLASAKRMEEAARLYNKANDKVKYTDEERLGFLKQYNRIMEEDAAEKKKLLQIDLDLYEREITLKAGYFKRVRYLNQSQREALKEDKKNYENLISQREKYENVLKDLNSTVADKNFAKSVLARVNNQLDAYLKVGIKISELSKEQYDRLDDEVKQKYTDMQAAIINANTELENETRRSTARIANLTIEMQNKEASAVVSSTKDKAAEQEKQAKNDALYLQFKEEMTNDIINAEADAFEKERIAIEKKYDDILKKARETYRSLELTEEEWDAFENAVNEKRRSELEANANNELETISKLKENIENINLKPIKLTNEQELANLQILKSELQELYKYAELAVEESGTVEQYERLLSIKQRLQEVNKQIAAQEKEIQADEKQQADQRLSNTTQILTSMQQVTGGLKGIFDELAQDNEKFAKFSRAMAITEAIITGALASVQAISKAVQSSATWIDMLVAITTVTAAVASVVGTTIAAMKETKINKAPKFADGGLVVGEGTGTSDSITAKLSNGEAVMNAKSVKATAPLLSAINQMYGGAPIGSDASVGSSDAMREMMLDVMAEVQPVVSVREITRVSNRVQVKENISKS